MTRAFSKGLSLSLLTLLCSSPWTTTEAQESSEEFKHNFSLSLQTFRYHYAERFIGGRSDGTTMALKSNQFGGGGSYKLTYNDWLFIQPEADLSYGLALYSNTAGLTFTAPSEPTILFESRLLTGVNFKIGKDLTLSPYTGIGFRYRNEDHRLTQSHQNDRVTQAKRTNRSWYIPLGLKARYDVNDRWFVNARGEYDFYLFGKLFDYSRPDQRSPSPLIFKQTGGWGVKSELLVGYRFDNVAMAFGPYFNYWKVNKTKNCPPYVRYRRAPDGQIIEFRGIAHEPKNTTTEFGIKLKFTF